MPGITRFMTMDAPAPKTPDLAALKQRLIEALGEKAVVSDPETLAPYLTEQRGRYQGVAPFVLRPATTEEVATAVSLCSEAGVPIVPQGGNTGLVAGAVPLTNRARCCSVSGA